MPRAYLCYRCRRMVDALPCAWCEDHQPKDTRDRSDRGSSSARGYTARWQRFRKRVYRAKTRANGGMPPPCASCGRPLGPSPHFDHIEPVSGPDDPRFFDESNIQLLHPECHGVKTRRDMAAGKTR